MNGAEALARTLVASGIEICFANPGTSERFLLGQDKRLGPKRRRRRGRRGAGGAHAAAGRS